MTTAERCLRHTYRDDCQDARGWTRVVCAVCGRFVGDRPTPEVMAEIYTERRRRRREEQK